MHDSLRRILEIHDLACGAILDRNGEIVASVGDFSAFDFPGLVSALLGPYGSPKATFDRLQKPEVLKPAMTGQGAGFSIQDCIGEFVVVLFGSERGDSAALYHFSQLVRQTINT